MCKFEPDVIMEPGYLENFQERDAGRYHCTFLFIKINIPVIVADYILRVCIHTGGLGTPIMNQHIFYLEKLTNFSYLLTGFEPLVFGS